MSDFSPVIEISNFFLIASFLVKQLDTLGFPFYKTMRRFVEIKTINSVLLFQVYDKQSSRFVCFSLVLKLNVPEQILFW